nr:iron chelate uptake ABC transporter family permease subunit [Gordonia humi]
MAIVDGRGSEEVRTLIGQVRLPRTLAGLLVGAALAWAGTLMQAMTRNPLADPGLLGVGSGAAFAVTIGMSWLGLRSALGIAASAIIGAAAVTTVVLILGLRGRADGSQLILAGVAFSMTISGIQSAITLLNPRALDAMRACPPDRSQAPTARSSPSHSRYWPPAL